MKELEAIARIQSDFPGKFGIPRQSGLCERLESRIVFEPEYSNADAVRGIEEYSHLWIIWGFSQLNEQKWSPTVRPPRLGGNVRKGVFATRSPFRPNQLGLSCVKLEKVEIEGSSISLIISGGDMADGTPVYDIKPYLPYVDSKPDASGSFSDDKKDYRLEVLIPDEFSQKLSDKKLDALKEVLILDPRPAYQQDCDRIYGFVFAGYEVKFKVSENTLTVIEICDNN